MYGGVPVQRGPREAPERTARGGVRWVGRGGAQRPGRRARAEVPAAVGQEADAGEGATGGQVGVGSGRRAGSSVPGFLYKLTHCSGRL